MDLSTATYLATFLPAVIGFLSSAVSSLMSREHWPSIVRAAITVAIVAIGAFSTEFLQSGHYSFTLATLKTLVAYVIAAEARSQFWAKTGVDAKLLAFPRKLPARGQTMSHSPGVADDEAESAVPPPPSSPPGQARHAVGSAK